MKTKTIIVIPARLKSSRLPHKLLLRKNEKTVLQHTYEIAKQTGKQVFITTDSPEIYDVCRHEITQSVCISNEEYNCGTDRVAGFMEHKPDNVNVINLQADEVGIKACQLNKLIKEFEYKKSSRLHWATLVHCSASRIIQDVAVNVSTVSCTRFTRNGSGNVSHIGVYAYTNRFLQYYTSLPQTENEIKHSLEQLRGLDNFHFPYAVFSNYPSFSINTKEDYDKWLQQ